MNRVSQTKVTVRVKQVAVLFGTILLGVLLSIGQRFLFASF